MSLPCPHDASPLTIRETEGHIGFLCASCRDRVEGSGESLDVFDIADIGSALLDLLQ